MADVAPNFYLAKIPARRKAPLAASARMVAETASPTMTKPHAPKMKRKLKTWLRRVMTVSVIWLFGVTTRKVRINWHILEKLMADKGPFLLGLWHNNVIIGIFDMSRFGFQIPTLVSRSRDGDDINWVSERFGYRNVRGSASAGATGALRGALRLLSGKTPVLVTPDGPRGPRYVLQAGIVSLARKKSVPIVPICWSATRRWELSSWDRMRVPKPFSKIYVIVGTPIMVDPEADDEAERVRIETVMRDQVRMAEAFSGADAHYRDPVLEEDVAEVRSGAGQGE